MSTDSKSFKRQMSSVVDKFRRGVAKTIQAASENEAYDSLPECHDLMLANKFTIKLCEAPTDCSLPSPSSWKQVTFEVSAKGAAGGKYFTGELVEGQGIVLKTVRGKSVMEVRLPDTSKTSMGKLLHPGGVTLYKIEFGNNLSTGTEWHILKNGHPCLNLVSTPLEEVFGFLKNCLHCCICMNGDYSIDFFKLDNESVGFVRPSIFTTKMSIELEFKDGSTNEDERGAILGTALLFLIVKIYPEYGEMLERSVPHL